MSDTSNRSQELRHALVKSQAEIMKALPGHIDPKRAFRVYLTAVQTTPRLFECSNLSIVGAVMQAAQLGLSLDGVFSEGYLIPRRNKHTGGQVAVFQIGYKGIRKLAIQGDPCIRDIYARCVHKNDSFKFDFEPLRIEHKPAVEERGELVCAYGRAVWRDKYERVFLATRADIARARDASDSARKGEGPWVDHEEAMWAKTALRRLCETLTLATESPLAKALAFEDQASGGEAGLSETAPEDDLPAASAA